MKNVYIIAFLGALLLTSCTSTQKGTEESKAAVKTTDNRLAQGKTIYDNSCGKCHDLPNPTDHSAQDWVGIMNSMAPKAGLNDEQHQMVYDYVVSVEK